MFTPSFLQRGATVTFGHRIVTGVDAYGNDMYGITEVDVSGCAISPGNSSEDWQGTEQIEARVTVHAPAATLVNLPFDYMVIEGRKYNIVGTPNGWVSPFTGTGSYLEIQGKQITTGGAAA